MGRAEIQLGHTSLVVPAVKILKYRILSLAKLSLSDAQKPKRFRQFRTPSLSELCLNSHYPNLVPTLSTQSCSLILLGLRTR